MSNNLFQVTNDGFQFAGNKDITTKEFKHIEDYFDKFLKDEDIYFSKAYYHLLKFENDFFYLKEFIVQIVWLALPAIYKHLKEGTSTQRIIDLIPQIIPNTLSPFELLLTKWVIADYFFFKMDKFKIDSINFYNTVRVTAERETKKFPTQISFIKQKVKENEKIMFGRWQLLSKQNFDQSKEISKFLISWRGNKNDLAYLIWKLEKENIISLKNFGITLSNIFVDENDKNIKNTLFNKYISEFNNNIFPKKSPRDRQINFSP